MNLKNWPSDKKIPKGMTIYENNWVIPKELEAFMPPSELLDEISPGCDLVYMHDGNGYSLFSHTYLNA